ncbi:MAG: EamA family transporter [Chromatiales bacterium]|nr:EamA family transporter [Chromatiales bacterium]
MWTSYLAVALAVVLLTLGQVLQKVAVDRLAPDITPWNLATAALRRPEMWAALACLGAGMLAWLLVLGSMDVSKAFPLLSSGHLLVLAAARYYFHEDIPRMRWAGAALIVAGIVLVAQT